MIKEIVFDMDGTIADLYGVTNWLEMLRAFDATPYEIAKPLVDMTELAELLKQLKGYGIRVSVITWLSKELTPDYGKAVRKAKRAWLKKYGFPFDSFRGVAYGTPKHEVEVKRLGKDEEALIFDDDVRVRRDWNLGGAINPVNIDICEVLKDLLETLG